MLPRFEVVARRRPVAIVAASGTPGEETLDGAVAPYVAVEATRTGPGPVELTLASGDTTLTAAYDDGVALHVTAAGRTTTHRSRRHGRPEAPVEAVALTLTGPQVTALTRERGAWVARSRFDLTERADGPSVHDETWLAGLRASASGPVAAVRSGRFGQLGLRDLRIVTRADGTAYPDPDGILLTATSAGPGPFPTAHASVWVLDPETLELRHRADLFSRRSGPLGDGVYGDHAVHLLHDADRWLVAASTWGDFDPKRRPVGVTLAETATDPTRGTHVLDARPWPLPTDGLKSVGVWDPHLARSGDGWLVGFVSATRYFRFHPALAAGPGLDALRLLGADRARRETEGTTLLATPDGWRVLASDRRACCYPVYDASMREVATLDAVYPTNIPWPTLVDRSSRSLLVGFNGQPHGGALVGYGSHGDVVLQRPVGLSP